MIFELIYSLTKKAKGSSGISQLDGSMLLKKRCYSSHRLTNAIHTGWHVLTAAQGASAFIHRPSLCIYIQRVTYQNLYCIHFFWTFDSHRCHQFVSTQNFILPSLHHLTPPPAPLSSSYRTLPHNTKSLLILHLLSHDKKSCSIAGMQ